MLPIREGPAPWQAGRCYLLEGVIAMTVPSNRGERTVLSYVKLDFLGDWEYTGDDYAFRPVGPEAELLVVTEEPTGSLVTYWFLVRRRADPPGGGSYDTD